MIVTSNVGGSGHRPIRPVAGRLLAAMHVEWTKNHPFANANRVFCYTIVWLALPGPAGSPVELTEQLEFGFTNVYVEPDVDWRDIITHAAGDLHTARTVADVIAGHELGRQLDVLAANSVPQDIPVTAHTIDAWQPGGIGKVRAMWRRRAANVAPRTIDTRFDLDGDLAHRRRLVDICAALDLDVAQPEPDGTSVTALHREWLDHRDHDARVRVTTHSLRQTIAAALVALHATDAARWAGCLNVNQVLAQLRDTVIWIDRPPFRPSNGPPPSMRWSTRPVTPQP